MNSEKLKKIKLMRLKLARDIEMARRAILKIEDLERKQKEREARAKEAKNDRQTKK